MAWGEKMGHSLRTFAMHKWMVMAVAIWIQACDGVGYAFGSYSPALKSALGYSQKQISGLGVAKDIGDNVGLFALTLCDVLPIWGLLVMGGFIMLIGYGWLWLIVTGQAATLPFWTMCVLMFVANQGESFLNTGVLMACVRNFPQNRGGIVGILKGFTGLSGAIFTQLYTSFYAPDQASFIFLVAVGPFMVTMFGCFIVRPVPHDALGNAKEDAVNFTFIYSVCLAIAAYLLGAMILQDIIDVDSTFQLSFAIGLLVLLCLPVLVPAYRTFGRGSEGGEHEGVDAEAASAPLISDGGGRGAGEGEVGTPATDFRADFTDFSEMEDERSRPDESEPLRRTRLRHIRTSLFKAVAEGAVKVKRRRKGPRRGENFTLSQALVKADFWLLFAIAVCGGGTGITAIDNLGQIGGAQGFASAHIFVSFVSIWSFLGRIFAGWASEIIVREYAAPRAIVLAFSQAAMAVGHFLFAMAWPGSMYVGSLLIGFGYGTHISIVPAAASELFGLLSFGALYNVLTAAIPTGSLVFLGFLAGPLYDREAAKQKADGSRQPLGLPSALDDAPSCTGAVCFQVTFLVMTAVCLLGVILNVVLIKRTYRVYQSLYGKNNASSPAAAAAAMPAKKRPPLRPVPKTTERGASSSK